MSDNMPLENVQYTEEGRPFINRRWRRYYGEIRACRRCGTSFFYQLHKGRPGLCCSNHCLGLLMSKEQFNNITPEPYKGTVDWSYVAGLFDGEGSIVRRQDQNSFQVHIAQKFGRGLEEIRCFLLSQGVGATIVHSSHDMEYLLVSNIYSVYEFILGIFGLSIIRAETLGDMRFDIEEILCVD